MSVSLRFAPDSGAMADVAGRRICAMNGLTLTWLLWERMLEEETQHFPRCVRSLRVSIGARGAASRPCVAGAVDIPVLQDSSPTRVAMDRAGIGMPSRYLPAMHLFLRARRTDGLFKNLTTIVWMHGGVAVAVENNNRDRRPAALNDPATGSPSSQRGGKCGGHVSGGPAGEAGMDPDRRIQIVVGCSHDSRSGRSGRQSADIDAF